MKRKSMRLAILGGAAALAIACASVSPVLAYFTDNTQATGGMKINVIPTTDITEGYHEGVKHVVITNAENSETPVFVRARVYANPEYLEEGTPSGANWSQTGDWYYYQEVVPIGGETDELLVAIKFPVYKTEEGMEEDPSHIGENFNVIVVYEAVPVQYDADGNQLTPEEADWTLMATSGKEGN